MPPKLVSDAQLGESDELGHDRHRVGAEGGLEMICSHEVCHLLPRDVMPAAVVLGVDLAGLDCRTNVRGAPAEQCGRVVRRVERLRLGAIAQARMRRGAAKST